MGLLLRLLVGVHGPLPLGKSRLALGLGSPAGRARVSGVVAADLRSDHARRAALQLGILELGPQPKLGLSQAFWARRVPRGRAGPWRRRPAPRSIGDLLLASVLPLR